MPLPTFTIVMGVLTCVPFGLAIRDTVKGVERPATAEERLEREILLEQARELEWEQDQAKRATERTANQKTAIGLVIGKGRATLGPAFDGATLGGPEKDAKAVDEKLAKLRSEYELDLVPIVDHHTLQSVFIKPTSRYDEMKGFCETLEETLETSWGDGHLDSPDRTIWINEGLAQRAILDESDDCELMIEKLAPLASWFSKDQDSIVPLWAIGQPIKRLEALLGRASSGDYGTQWAGLGIGNGIGATSLRAIVRNGKIVAITASAETDSTTQDEVAKHISAVMGKEPAWQDVSFVWKTKPRVELESGSAHLSLTVGTIPEEE